MPRFRPGSPNAECADVWRAVPRGASAGRRDSAPDLIGDPFETGECQGRALPWDAILSVVEPRLVTQECFLVADEQCGQEDAACPGGDAERGCPPAVDDAVPEEQRVPEEEDRDDDNRRREGDGEMGRNHAGAQLAPLEQDGDEPLN